MTVEELIEQAAGALRERSADGEILASPAWRALDSTSRRQAFDLALIQRRLEAAVDEQWLSTPARAVLARIRG